MADFGKVVQIFKNYFDNNQQKLCLEEVVSNPREKESSRTPLRTFYSIFFNNLKLMKICRTPVISHVPQVDEPLLFSLFNRNARNKAA